MSMFDAKEARSIATRRQGSQLKEVLELIRDVAINENTELIYGGLLGDEVKYELMKLGFAIEDYSDSKKQCYRISW